MSAGARLDLALEANGWVVCGDEHGIAWGEGETSEQAVSDWENSAREVRDLLRRSSPNLTPMMAHRLALLDRWFEES